ncbi:MAG TPA: type II secretion system inner membrane protein GspF [Thermodesulfobacteriota bacterium]|jgi:general secretion pathway protein F|nr:type II secretion system inner membrane protein GspF [Thermodesulfobacteriota bacterium]
MPVYKYKAINEKGKTVEGVLDAESAKSATEKLKRQGVFLSSLSEVKKEKARSFSLFKGISTSELALTTRQFSTLISAGLPLEASLVALSEQTEDAKLSQVLTEVKDKISEGSSLNNALREHPNVFSDLYVNIVRAGEASGTLDIVLLRLADFLEKQTALRSRVRSALVYPIFMFFIGSGVLFFMMSYVIPKIARIFEESRKALPYITQLLIGFSSFFSQNLFVILILLIGLSFIAYKFSKRERGKMLLDRLTLRIPIFGRIAKMVIISRFTRTLGTLLASGIPLLNAIEIAEAIAGNTVYSNALRSVRDNIKEGTSIAGPLRDSGVFPPLVTRMIAVGEQTGELEEMLVKIADTYDLQIETSVSALTSLLEPIMIVIMGVVVGFIVFAILLPIFDLTSTIGG